MEERPDTDMPKADKHASATIRTLFEEEGTGALGDFDDGLERPLPPGVVPGEKDGTNS